PRAAPRPAPTVDAPSRGKAAPRGPNRDATDLEALGQVALRTQPFPGLEVVGIKRLQDPRGHILGGALRAVAAHGFSNELFWVTTNVTGCWSRAGRHFGQARRAIGIHPHCVAICLSDFRRLSRLKDEILGITEPTGS